MSSWKVHVLVLLGWGVSLLLPAQGFVPNGGQWPDAVAYGWLHASGFIGVEQAGLVFSLADPQQAHAATHREHSGERLEEMDRAVWRMVLVDSQPSTPVLEDTLGVRWRFLQADPGLQPDPGLPCGSRIRYPEVWPGIDWVIHVREGRLKYDFVVAPGADPSTIAWEYDGVVPRKNAQGELEFDTPWGLVHEAAPVAFQWNGRALVDVPVDFVEQERGWSLAPGEYDAHLPLTLDPEVVWSSYALNLSLSTSGMAADGGVVFTNASPFLPEEVDDQTGVGWSEIYTEGSFNVLVSKLSEDGSTLEWVAVLGSSGTDTPLEVATAPDGTVYVLASVGADFPLVDGGYVTPGASETGNTVLFALAEDGSALESSAVLVEDEYVFGRSKWRREVDGLDIITMNRTLLCTEDAVYVFGSVLGDVLSFSFGGNFYGTPTSYGFKTWLVSLSPDLTTVQWSSLIDSGVEETSLQPLEWTGALTGMHATLWEGEIITCGRAVGAVLPYTEGTLQPEPAGDVDGYICRFDAQTGACLGSTYIGGEDYEQAWVVHANDAGIHVLGKALDTGPTDEVDATWGNGRTWLISLDHTLSSLNKHYRIGSETPEVGLQEVFPYGLGSNACGNLHFLLNRINYCDCGECCSVGLQGWPLTPDATQTGAGQVFIGEIDPTADALLFGSYYGGGALHGDRCQAQNGRLLFGACVEEVFAPVHEVTGSTGAYRTGALGASDSNGTLFDFNDGFAGQVELSEAQTTVIPACAENAVSFEVNASSGTLTWDFGDGADPVEGPAQSDHLYAEAGQYTVQIVATDSTTCNTSDTLVIALDIPQTYSSMELDWVLDDIDPCLLPQDIFGSFTGTDADTWSWTLNGSEISTTTQMATELTTTGPHLLELTATDFACDSTATLAQTIALTEPLDAELEVNYAELFPCTATWVTAQVEGTHVGDLVWEDQTGTSTNPVYQGAYTPGAYPLSVTVSHETCPQSELLETVISIPEPTADGAFAFPNVITPGQDDFNAAFRCMACVSLEELELFEVRIFNRWGGLLFESTDPAFTWTPTSLSEEHEVVYYTVVYRLICGEDQYLSGDLTVKTGR